MLLVLLSLSIAPAAQAHGYIVRAIPEDRTVLERPPARIQYWFSEALEPEFSSITLRDQTGREIATGGVDAEDDTLLVLRPPADLPDGAYIVSLRPAFASDGHVVAETRVFFVGAGDDSIAGSAASDRAVPLEVVWRALVLSATSLLLGVFTVYNRVLVPAWGNPAKYIRGGLPPRVMTRLTWVAGGALALALAANALALLQNAMVLFNTGMGAVVSNNLWNTARLGSRFGDVWNVRMLLLVMLAAGLALTIAWRNDKPRTVGPFWSALMWGAALVVGTFAVTSHASGSLVMPWVGILMHWLHATAVAVWTGGLAALVLVLPTALKPYTGEARRLALLAAMRRFSRVAVGALLITVTTGIYNASNWLFTPAELTGTRYGLSLTVKVLMVAGLLIVGAVHHIAARPEAYARWQGMLSRMGAWRVTLPVEVLLAAAVMVGAAFLGATPPPTPDFIEAGAPAPRASQTVNGLTLDMTLTPGGPGVNTYDTQISSGGSPLTDAAVFVQMVSPARDVRGVWHEAEAIDAGLYVSAGDELDGEGRWLALVDVLPADGEATRFAFDWTISDEATVIESISPRWQHWAALALVHLALLWVIAPGYRAFMAQMQLNAVTGVIALVAVAITAGASVYGYQLIQEQQAANAAVLNPPPEQVNTVLPDQASLERGAALYAQACNWEAADERVYESLLQRLPRTRDDELFTMTGEGWRTLPPCDAALGVDDRWDVVNYFRTRQAR